MAKAKKKIKLIPPDLEQCQVMKYNPLMLGGSVNYRCTNKPGWIVSETSPAADGLMGSQSCCKDCRDKYKDEMTEGYKWERI